jgi:hypothetical protein
MRLLAIKSNFVGAARREIQEGGFAVESSLLAGCGLEAHDSDPSEAWTSSNHEHPLKNDIKTHFWTEI